MRRAGEGGAGRSSNGRRAKYGGSSGGGGGGGQGSGDQRAASRVGRMVSENALIVFGKQGCCMCHVLKLLLQGLGVNPTVYEVDGDEEESEVGRELAAIAASGGGGEPPQLPAVFVGGRLFGGLEKVMATHISGELVPILKDAGALWL